MYCREGGGFYCANATVLFIPDLWGAALFDLFPQHFYRCAESGTLSPLFAAQPSKTETFFFFGAATSLQRDKTMSPVNRFSVGGANNWLDK